MKKWIVRWTTDGFNTREEFNTKEEAKRYYKNIQETMDYYINEIDMWEATPEEEAIAERQ